uniref:RRM domain-containing protein n=1 Tax=Alexandrium monilatum TaxID=311494 RepID=A0A6T1MQ97_9DINO
MGWGGGGKGWGGSGKDGWGGNKGGWTTAWQPWFQKQPWGKGGDKAKGKGKGGRAKGHRDMGFTNEQKVWIGGIPENATFKELFELLKPAGAKWCECFDGNGKGTGVACFSSQEEAQEAIAKFQGSPLNGAPLQLDVWEKKPKTT